MKRMNKGSRRGFSLVELLAVVLILAVLAGVAIPLYINTRKSSAARACKANLAAIAAAESAYALRNGGYTGVIADLVGAPEGLAKTPTCPLTTTSNAYSLTLTGTAPNQGLTIQCASNETAHEGVVGVDGDYDLTMAPPVVESTIP